MNTDTHEQAEAYALAEVAVETAADVAALLADAASEIDNAADVADAADDIGAFLTDAADEIERTTARAASAQPRVKLSEVPREIVRRALAEATSTAARCRLARDVSDDHVDQLIGMIVAMANVAFAQDGAKSRVTSDDIIVARFERFGKGRTHKGWGIRFTARITFPPTADGFTYSCSGARVLSDEEPTRLWRVWSLIMEAVAAATAE